MSQSANGSRVPITANKIITGVLFGFAVAAFIIRSYIRIRIYKKFLVEDFLLLFAVVCLCVATGLAYSTLPNQYALLQVILHGLQDGLAFDILGNIPKITKEENIGSFVYWLVIFSVKTAFLLFFRRLISRLRGLNIWWWCSTTFTVIAGLACVAAVWLTCPYLTIEGMLLKCGGLSADSTLVRDITITTVMDVTTDLLILSFPFIILWKVRIDARQKMGLAFSLCLPVVMVIVAIVRIAGMRQDDGPVDIVWLAFWQQQESSIAIFMASVSAFRSLFVQSPAKTPAPRPTRESPSYRRRMFLRRRHERDLYDVEGTKGLPQIPGATLTSLSTTAGRNRHHDEKAGPSQQLQSSIPPSDHGQSTEINTTSSYGQDTELGLPAEAVILSEHHEAFGGESCRFNDKPWWKTPWQSDANRTGYWDMMSLFRSGHNDSMTRSNIQSESQP